MSGNGTRTRALIALLPLAVAVLLGARLTGARSEADALAASRDSLVTRFDAPRAPSTPARSAVAPRDVPGPGIEAASPSVARTLVHGLVRTLEGRPVAGVRVGAPGTTGATSDARGAFELALAGPPARLGSLDPRWATVRTGAAFPRAPEREALVVVAPRIALGGVVLDASGRPVRDARVALRPALDALPDRVALETRTNPRTLSVRTGADGAFELDEAPALGNGLLLVTCAGFAPLERPAPRADSPALTLVLGPDPTLGPLVHGRVLTHDGRPASGAEVALAGARATSDLHGGFALRPTARNGTHTLSATLAGFETAHVELQLVSDREPAPLELVLGAPTGSISGRALDAAGFPVKGARLSLRPVVDPRRFVRPSHRELRAERDGSFRFDDVPAGEYEVCVGDLARSGVVRAGAREVTLRIDASAGSTAERATHQLDARRGPLVAEERRE